MAFILIRYMFINIYIHVHSEVGKTLLLINTRSRIFSFGKCSESKGEVNDIKLSARSRISFAQRIPDDFSIA